jgi:hypothetical protein
VTSPHEILGVTKTANDEVIEAAYRILVKKHHPDQGGDAEDFDRIKTAYEEITSETPQSESIFGDDHDPFLYSMDSYSVRTELNSGISIVADSLALSLLNVFRTDVSDLSMKNVNKNRFVAIFEVENITSSRQKYKPLDQTKIIANDGHQYKPDPTEQINPYSNQLRSDLNVKGVKLSPHSKAYNILIIPELMDESPPDRIIYTHNIFQGDRVDGVVQGTEQFEFNIGEEDWDELLPLES